MTNAITSSQIDQRIESMPSWVFDAIKDDVLWNFNWILLPWFQSRQIQWNNTDIKDKDLRKLKRDRLLPTHQQWEWLEEYLKEKDLHLDAVFKLLWFKSQEKYAIAWTSTIGGIWPRSYWRLHVCDSMLPNIEPRIKWDLLQEKDLLRLLVRD